MSIFNLIKTTKLGYAGGNPPSMAIQPDTLHFSSSVTGNPAFGSYKQSWLRKLKPTRLAGNPNPTRYTDNPPQ